MKKSLLKSKLFIASITMIALIIIGGCFNFATLQLPTDAINSCTVTNVDFISWFESGVVTKDGVVKPANSITFSDIPNCDFYKWSEQMFLWLTSPTPPRYGGGSGRIFNSSTFYDVSPLINGERTFIPHPSEGISPNQSIQLRTSPLGPNKLPIVFENKTRKMFEIEPPSFGKNGKQLISNNEGEHVELDEIKFDENKKPLFFDISGREILGAKPIFRKNLNLESTIQKFTAKEVIVFLDAAGIAVDVDPGQAGGLNVLMSQQGSLVYFQITVNDAYAYFKTGVENGVISSNQFPTTQNQIDAIENFASANKLKSLVDKKALVVEIKTSWVEASTIPSNELSRFITMNTIIPTYDISNPNEWVPNGQKSAKLAMIGMHVVGSTNGHPEMIWATFEHVSAAPNGAYSYINSSSSVISIPQTTNGNWILCANNSSIPFNDPHMGVNFSTSSIEPITPHLISPSNTIRDHAWGASPSQKPNPLVSTTAHSNSDIISINNSVRAQLVPGDVRANYVLTGATWTIGGGAPSGPFISSTSIGTEVGTSRLANTSMETYVQATNCFSCHATNTVNVSAVWSDLKPLFQ